MDRKPFIPFGEMLKTARLARHITQQQFATKLGVHRNTISSWELGSYLPATRGLVLELARHLTLDESETRHLLEASLTTPSPYWLIPFPRNPFFTGREEILEMLHMQLGIERTVAITYSSALHGLGGIGKTQLALEYAYRHALEYNAIFWIGAETAEQIISDLLRIAEVLQLPGRDDKNQQHVVAEVHHWLTVHAQWLLIWDNVEDLNLLSHFLPAARQGAVLITTRSQALGTLARGIDLFPMEHEEGMLFLLRRAKVLEPEATLEQVRQLAEQIPLQYTVAADLVRTLGGLPLALDQAGAYLEETGCGLTDYLQRYTQQSAHLLDRRGTSGEYHPLSVAATFRLSRERVEQEQRVAADILRVCALLHAENIPEELFVAGSPHLGPELTSLVTDLSHFDQAIGILRNLSLLQRQSETHMLSLHRLVQAVLQEQMGEQEQSMWLGRVLAALNAVFPEVTRETWEQCERLLPHVLACAAAIPEQAGNDTLAEVLQKAADYLRARAQYEQAEPLYLRAVHIEEQLWGPQHPLVASALHHLANLSYDQGKYEQAEALYLRALHIREQILGPEHPDATTSLNNLGRLYWSQGKYKQAEPLFLQALHIREQVLEPQNTLMGASLNNLAILYTEQGRYEQAEPLFERALHTWEQAYGPEDPHVAASFNNLAILSYDQGKYEQAESLYQRALSIQKKALGAEHPELAHPLNGLADIYTVQGAYEQAEPLYQQALRIREKALGSTHPLVAQILHSLANLYAQQGKNEQAEPLFQRALRLQEEQLGEHHPETAQTLHDLAIFQQKQGKLSEALSLAERALTIRSQSLGDTHLKTSTTRALHTQLVQEQTRVQEAAVSEWTVEVLPDRRREKCQEERASLPLHKADDPSSSESDPLQGFLAACCELHPRAWCRSADLWGVYEHWVQEHQERFPLSRRALTKQLQARGCRADRTKTARIWRGITIAR